ncbi:MAG: hypothetical protein HZC28_11225 [Spirochaetes bacterium]|nr:hypothetical protein [Spirochaetota bacterium]
MNDIAKTSPPYVEVAVNSTYDIIGNRHIREYSNQYQKVVIRHDNNFIVSEVRLVGFIEKHLQIVITRDLMNWYSVVPEDADEDMPDFTDVRFGRTSVSELSREDVIRELMKYVTDAADGRKVERLLADIITRGFSNEPLDAEFIVDFYLSMADRYCASIGSEKRTAFLNYLELHKAELETYFTRKFITADFDFFTKFDTQYRDEGGPPAEEVERLL